MLLIVALHVANVFANTLLQNVALLLTIKLLASILHAVNELMYVIPVKVVLLENVLVPKNRVLLANVAILLMLVTPSTVKLLSNNAVVK